MSAVAQTDLVVLAVGLLLALALVAIGAFRLARIAKALKARSDAYADLPVLAYVKRTIRKTDAASRAIARVPGLVYRATAARRDIANAIAKIRTVLTTPTSVWRLGEWFVTGK